MLYFSRTSEEHRQWIYVLFILVGHLSITVICGLYLNIRGFKTVRFLFYSSILKELLFIFQTHYILVLS